jgi:hypothetical protein
MGIEQLLVKQEKVLLHIYDFMGREVAPKALQHGIYMFTAMALKKKQA